jgi:fibronectin type 3 domain-containing protein
VSILFGAVLLAAGIALSSSPDAGAAVGDPVIAVGGDIACAPGSSATTKKCQQVKTGSLVTSINPTAVLPLGDSQYAASSSNEYAGSYNTTGWGTLKSISRPSTGNHEYNTTGATGYFGYFGANAGDPTKGYYSWNVTAPGGAFRWHMIALNSECAQVGGCGKGSPQEVWLRSDLAANPNVCTMAYWHRPRFSSSSTTPSSTTFRAFWTALYNAGADVVLAGHAHDYERFAPQTADGAADAAKGLREFVVGTGGDGFQTMGTPIANSVVRQNTSFGILKMTLHAGGYDWQFMPAAGYSFTDSGTASCHSAPAQDVTAPSQPTGLTATASSASQVNLSWTASTDDVGVKNYNIYRGSNGGTPTLLTTTTTNATTYIDTSVIEQTAYAYQVQAIDAASNLSQLSTAASVTTPRAPDTTPPSTPTNLTAEVVSGNEVDLSWIPSTDGGTGVSGYRVYRGPAGATTLTLLGTTTGTSPSYQDLTASPNTRYEYQVAAFDGAGNTSAVSGRVTAATPPGGGTQAFTFPVAEDATIDQANPSTTLGTSTRLVADNSPVNDFLLRFNVDVPACESITSATLRLRTTDGSVKGGDFYTTGAGWIESTVTWNTAPARGVLLNSLGAVTTATTYTVDVTGGVTTASGEVDFRIGSTSSDGARYYSREGGTATQDPLLTLTCSTGTTDTLEPTAPTNLSAAAPNGGEVDLSWGLSTDNVAVTAYQVYRDSSLIGTVPGNALSYQDTTVSPGTSYSYHVTAVDAANNESPDSNTASVTTS